MNGCARYRNDPYSATVLPPIDYFQSPSYIPPVSRSVRKVRHAITEAASQEAAVEPIHLAAQIDVGHSLVHPLEDAKTNILGTIRLLEYCKKYNVRKVIFASSAAVYGKPRQSLIQETHPTEPLSCCPL